MTCIACPVGHACPDTMATAPTPCPAGTYANLPGRMNCTRCGGTMTSPVGATACAPCLNAACSLVVDGVCGKVSAAFSKATQNALSDSPLGSSIAC